MLIMIGINGERERLIPDAESTQDTSRNTRNLDSKIVGLELEIEKKESLIVKHSKQERAQTQLIEGVDESQDTPDNQDASVEEAPQVEALEEEIERAPGGRNEEGTEVLDVADAEPVHVVTPDHANKNQEVDEVNNVAPPISIHDSHNYQRPTRSGRVPRYTDRYVEYMESFGNAASTDPAPKRSSFFELEVDEPQTYKQAVE
ncbi:hypothetical protein DAPPUDRAFT_329852 [Daphnia pulex]|uniref:Uncharacterized protein n=1 Tax=Daphnia pulex TaxID=6669 RepID=E9HHT8_DAPPU|nr:hypothetical protein DAPPUDRAFT_329852 [Daphnia pulex]|eukprot:EFX68709.1 hypothetical protein DAPPUDRAFT_329852 [Daphnia pulex]